MQRYSLEWKIHEAGLLRVIHCSVLGMARGRHLAHGSSGTSLKNESASHQEEFPHSDQKIPENLKSGMKALTMCQETERDQGESNGNQGMKTNLSKGHL